MNNRNLQEMGGRGDIENRELLSREKQARENALGVYGRFVEMVKNSMLVKDRKGSASGLVLTAGGVLVAGVVGATSMFGGGGEKAPGNEPTSVAMAPSVQAEEVQKEAPNRKGKLKIEGEGENKGDCIETELSKYKGKRMSEDDYFDAGWDVNSCVINSLHEVGDDYDLLKEREREQNVFTGKCGMEENPKTGDLNTGSECLRKYAKLYL